MSGNYIDKFGQTVEPKELYKYEESRGKRCCRAFLSFLKENLLLICLLLSMGIGVGMGLGLRALDPPMTKRDIMYLNFPGDLLMRMLKMLILPLILSSLIAGVSTLKAAGRLGFVTVIYYLSTTLLAVALGIVLVTTIQPGRDSSKEQIDRINTMARVHPVDAIMDIFRNCFPDNLVTMCFQTSRTTEKAVEIAATNVTNATTEYEPSTNMVGGMNVLGLVVFSLAFGLIIGRLGEKGLPLVALFEALNEATMRLVTLVIWYSPIGICFLIASKLVEMDDIEKTLQQIGLYALTVLLGLFIHGIITLPLILVAFGRRNPIKYLMGCGQALITALGTSSSSATLPVTFNCLENKIGISQKVTRFVLPIGATINMDGTALYEAVAAIFIAQVNNVPLDFGKIVIISLTATAASIGAAGVPQAGLVTMVIVLTAVGLPTEDVTLIIAIDWFLDRFRTMINVWGDSIGAGVSGRLCRQQMKEEEESNDGENLMSAKHPPDSNGYINKAYRADMKATESQFTSL